MLGYIVRCNGTGCCDRWKRGVLSDLRSRRYRSRVLWSESVEGTGVVGGTGWSWGGVVHPETSIRATEKKIIREYHNGRDFSMHMSFLGFGYKTIRR